MYKNNMQMNHSATSHRNLLLALQEVEFVCCDLRLYCDTHPEDKDALEKYNAYSRKLRELKSHYDAEIGPLMNFGYSTSDKSWLNATPWPWEHQ